LINLVLCAGLNRSQVNPEWVIVSEQRHVDIWHYFALLTYDRRILSNVRDAYSQVPIRTALHENENILLVCYSPASI